MNREEAHIEFRKRQAELASRALTKELAALVGPLADIIAIQIDNLIQARMAQAMVGLRKEMEEMKVQIARYGGNDSD